MAGEATTWTDRARATLQWWRVPLGAVFVAGGIYLIRRETAWLWVGMAVTLVGELIQLWSASHLEKDQTLATSGPYSYVRNPMYVGRFLVLLGFVAMIQQAWWPRAQLHGIPLVVAAYVVLFALYARSRVGREEARLRVVFGDGYDHYCKEVPRFLPRIRPYSRATARRWQWSRIVANNEHLNLMCVAAVLSLALIRLYLVKGY